MAQTGYKSLTVKVEAYQAIDELVISLMGKDRKRYTLSDAVTYAAQAGQEKLMAEKEGR